MQTGTTLSADAGTVHHSRSLMLTDLRAVMDRTEDRSASALRAAILQHNILGKPTVVAEKAAYRHLRALYGLDETLPAFRALCELWDECRRSGSDGVEAQNRMALICAATRDPVLLALTQQCIEVWPGRPVDGGDVTWWVEREYGSRFSEAGQQRIAAHLRASWHQAGLLSGHRKRIRCDGAVRSPEATAFALYVGALPHPRAYSYDTPWTRMLDLKPWEIRDLSDVAHRRGWIDRRDAGGVVEITFRRFDSLLAADTP